MLCKFNFCAVITFNEHTISQFFISTVFLFTHFFNPHYCLLIVAELITEKRLNPIKIYYALGQHIFFISMKGYGN